MISLTLSVYLSVCLSTYLSVYQFYLSICPSLFCPSVNSNSSHRSNFDTNTSVASSLHLSLCLSFLLVLRLFPFFFPLVFLPRYFFLFPISFSSSLFPSSPTFSPFCVETVTLLELKRWSFYSSQCSSRFNFYSTVVLSLIKIPTKKAKQDTEKNNTSRHSF